MPDQDFALLFEQRRFPIAKVNALQRLRDMHFSRRAAFLHAVPIVNTISRVAVLLDLDDQISRADRMQPSARKKDCVAGPTEI